MNKEYLSVFKTIDFEKIIDHPNILIAAAFWDKDRYKAACTCYKYMRAIDDLIDCHKSSHKTIAENEKVKFTDNVKAWISMAHSATDSSSGENELLDTIRKFHIPLWPLEDFANSMIYDINHDGFSTLDDFLRYSRGASVAPASIFVHLSGLTKGINGYALPAFDVRAAATPCAIFSYVVHIIRDFRKDQMNHLNYFAVDILQKNGLTSELLKKMADGDPVHSGFRNMITEYCELADKYRQLTCQVIKDIWPLLEPRYRLSLLVIFNLYLMVFERIDPERGTFSTEELNPTPEEIKERVYKTISGFRE